ncbi:Uu.00g020460.m01.CDS01 [Anthostomella pinea]|uniref:Uu.00g020460.m01.CDS01 n=1 Tax=Anthostomella pinea TaxID=933095 RepID=A0AAI8VZI4_9PEZI|nr:Uu.00g020460.m01.CDS01 [Anthostomella pinea]
MASPERIRAQPELETTDSYSKPSSTDHDHELLRSLDKLYISTSPAAQSSNSPSWKSNAQLKQAVEESSSASPSARAPPRSPVNRVSLNGLGSGTRSATPNLLRKTSTSSLRSSGAATPSRAPSRRGSTTTFLSPTATRSPTVGLPRNMEDFQQKPAPTAASVASAYMKKELEMLHATGTDQPAETVVILHDACYGHRYSRPRTSKNTLSTIVERPERIQASVLGVSIAYVRLGERHCDGKNPFHPGLDPTTMPNIPFRIHKTTRSLPLTSPAVTNVHGMKWMEELKVMCDSAETNLDLKGGELRRPDMNRGPDAETPPRLHEGDLYLCSESLDAFEGALGAVCEAVDAVFSKSAHKRAFVAVRPPGHHCSASYPSGFCWVNNVHVGIMHGILNHGLTHVAIIDFDLHHGDGSQAIAWQHNQRGLTKNAAAWKKTSIGYFSVHDINSYPCEYGDEEKVKNASLCIDNAHGQNIWNVHLHEWKSDVEFWRLYQSKYSILLEKTRNYLRLQTERYRASGQVPKAAIFLSAGFDASEWEGAGMQRHKVNVPTEFYARLTRDVVKIASEEGLSVEGRVISVLEGGYSDRALYSGVLSHLSGFAGSESLAPKDEPASATSYEMGNRIGSYSRRSTLNENELRSLKALEFPYDPNWWSVPELDRLDAAMVAPPPASQKPRNITPGNYSSPTQASNAKLTEAAKVRRPLSGLSPSQTIIPRAPTPPHPNVPWTAAAHELSKLLIPSGRQTNSCKHSELNAEATKARRDRQSLQIGKGASNDASAPPPPVAPTRMSLRERKAKPNYLDEEEDAKSRRKTVGGPTGLSAEKASARGIPTQNGTKHIGQASRRLSAASTLTTMQDSSEPKDPVPRPGSSQSIRSESSMSVRTQASTVLNVKKTRAAAPPRKDSARAPRAPRKTKPAVSKANPAIAQQPASPAKATLPEAPSGKAQLLPLDQGPAAGSSRVSTLNSSNATDDLESITNGMKKIKINVLTKEKKEAKQRAEAERKAAADQEAARQAKPTADKVGIGSPASEQKPVLPVTGTLSEEEKRSVDLATHNAGYQAPTDQSPNLETPIHQYEQPPQVHAKVESAVPMAPAIKTPAKPGPAHTLFRLDSPDPLQATPRPAQHEDLFVQYQPHGPPPHTIPLSGPVRILDPNTGTPARPTQLHPPVFTPASVPPSPARKGGHGFTATSAIPFASRPVQETQAMSNENVTFLPQPTVKADAQDEGVWEIPETPDNRG